MELGMIGLGRMGGLMTERLIRGGHDLVGYARHAEAVSRVQALGGRGADSLASLCGQLKPRRAVWLMVPSGEVVDQTIEDLLPLLSPGDVVIDGGNSNFKDTVRRAAMLKSRGFSMVDCGTSGGIWGLQGGYSLMVGGEAETVAWLRPIFETLAPAPDRGWGHVGGHGAGHLVKMVHNGIEYGLMQAYAEGFALLRAKQEYHLDLAQISEIWRHGSVVRSWLLDLLASALAENPEMKGIAPEVADSGEGRWTVFEAIDSDVPAPVITLALIERLRSRDHDSYTDRLLSAMRRAFGGHPIKTEP
jgi:6-phosphogluconate dehydrogenase